MYETFSSALPVPRVDAMCLFPLYVVLMLQNVGQKEVGIKTGGKLPGGKAAEPNSIEREFFNGKDKKGVAYPPNMIYAIDEKA